jgi:hypothetical protein
MRHFTAFYTSGLALLAHFLLTSFVHADPQLTSWFTLGSTKYARIYTSVSNRTAGISTATWSNQTLPTYAGVHEINYSASWVYIKNTGLAPYIMGPWNNPNLPKNQGTSTNVYRFPRIPTVISNLTNTTNRTLTGQGSIGFLVDGVALYNTSDGFSYSVYHGKDAAPNANIGPGDGVWNRDAWTNEWASFDYPLNHPQPSGQYHAHANPIGVRYVLGDNINYDSSTKIYSENTSATSWKHSPIIGWVNDGLPLYGPYGYSDPTNSTSPIRKMVSGYVLRNGTYGTANLAISGRTSLPKWAQQAQGKTNPLISSEYGPLVSTNYELGHFSEDYDYLGDLEFTQGVSSTVNGYTTLFDLNKYNARYCVTPEYPSGTWAYFTTITPSGTPWYPYNVGRWYMANPPASTGQPPTPGNSTTVTVMNADTPLTKYYKGGTNNAETWSSTPVTVSGSTVTLSWNAVEGGTYQVSTSTGLSSSTWTSLSETVTPAGNNGTKTDMVNTGTTPRKFYKFTRAGMADYDSLGY